MTSFDRLRNPPAILKYVVFVTTSPGLPYVVCFPRDMMSLSLWGMLYSQPQLCCFISSYVYYINSLNSPNVIMLSSFHSYDVLIL